jgi:hypothetical protein
MMAALLGFTATKSPAAENKDEKPASYQLAGHFSTAGDEGAPVVAVTVQVNQVGLGISGFIRVQDRETHEMFVFEPVAMEVRVGQSVGKTECTISAVAPELDPTMVYTFIIVLGSSADGIPGSFSSLDFPWSGTSLHEITLH